MICASFFPSASALGASAFGSCASALDTPSNADAPAPRNNLRSSEFVPSPLKSLTKHSPQLRALNFMYHIRVCRHGEFRGIRQRMTRCGAGTDNDREETMIE